MTGIRLHDDVTTTDTDDTRVLLDQRSGRFWQLNQTGAAMLDALVAGTPPAEVAERFATGSAGVERVRSDIDALLRGLREAGLLR